MNTVDHYGENDARRCLWRGLGGRRLSTSAIDDGVLSTHRRLSAAIKRLINDRAAPTTFSTQCSLYVRASDLRGARQSPLQTIPCTAIIPRPPTVHGPLSLFPGSSPAALDSPDNVALLLTRRESEGYREKTTPVSHRVSSRCSQGFRCPPADGWTYNRHTVSK